jgi:hypothetical protein
MPVVPREYTERSANLVKAEVLLERAMDRLCDAYPVGGGGAQGKDYERMYQPLREAMNVMRTVLDRAGFDDGAYVKWGWAWEIIHRDTEPTLLEIVNERYL